jgi:hypothetical protein
MNERVEKIKNHVREHKTIYISAGISVGIAGITTLVMREKLSKMQSVMEPEMQSVTGKLSSLSI